MKVSKTVLFTTIGTMAAGSVGLLVKSIQRRREKVFDARFLQQELAVLEGEGGICLS